MEGLKQSRLDPAPGRLAAIDGLRVGAVALVVLEHAAVSYTSAPVPSLLWAVHDPSTSPLFDWLFWWTNGITMPLFFLIAGVSAAQLWAAGGASAFVRNRTRRLLVPFLVGSVVLLPLTFYVWATGWWLQGRCTVTEIRRVVFGPEIQDDLYGPAHLWFLEYLMIFCAAYWVSRLVIGRRAARVDRVARFRRYIFAGGEYAAWATPLLLALPTVVILSVRTNAGISFHNSFVPCPERLLYHAVFFTAGAVVFSNRETLRRCMPLAVPYAILSVPACMVMMTLLRRHLAAPLDAPGRFVLAVALALFTWLTLLAALGAAQQVWRSRLSATVAWLAAASYWIYLVHFPFIGLTEVALVRVTAPAFVKFALAAGVGLAVSLWTYHHFVDGTVVGVWLSGSPLRLRATPAYATPVGELNSASGGPFPASSLAPTANRRRSRPVPTA